MQLITVFSSFIILASARPVPQDVPIVNSTNPTSLNSTTTISLQDALGLLSAGSAASATSASAFSLAPTLATSMSATSVGSAAVTDTDNAYATPPSTTLAGSNLASVVSSSSLPSTASMDGDPDGNSTATSTADISSLSVLPTASINNNTGSATATLPSATTVNTPISYLIPSDIPRACMVKAASIAFASGAITPSVADITVSSPTGVLSKVSPFSIGANTLTESGSVTANNASATATSLTGSTLSNATGTISASVSGIPGPLTPSRMPASTAIATSVSVSAFASHTLTTGTAPLQLVKRIAQDDLPHIAQSWQDLCLVSGGDIFTNEPCVTLAGVNGINALLADADPCDQQDNADAMIDFAKSAGVVNSADLIANAIAYRQHARNAFSVSGVIPSTPYCQKAPKNDELKGLVNAQLPGVNAAVFGGPSFGLVAFGDPSSCPFGTTPGTDSCSCS